MLAAKGRWFTPLLLLCLSACFTESGAPPGTTPVVSAPNEASAAPLAVNRIIFDIPRGQLYAANSENTFSCAVTTGDGATWDGGKEFSDEPDLIAVVEDRLSAAGYNVARNEAALFDTGNNASKARFLIGGIVKDIDLRICGQRHWYDGVFTGAIAATGTVQVEWQVFSVLQQSVVATFSTTGSAGSGEATADGIYIAIRSGIEDAANGITANQDFRRVLADDKSAMQTSAVENSSALTLKGLQRLSGSFSSNAAKAQAATVLIVGQGHGSGFLVTSDGYLLTNYHVVGEAAEVRVELADGTVSVGQVLRRNAVRDIALVKLALDGLTALPLSLGLPGVGSEVFAVGAPLDAALTGTVTKGIVSSIRELDGQRYIQGDLDIQPGNSGGPLTDDAGNVVGVSVSGLAPEGTSVGINFFIPIADALAAMNVTVN